MALDRPYEPHGATAAHARSIRPQPLGTLLLSAVRARGARGADDGGVSHQPVSHDARVRQSARADVVELDRVEGESARLRERGTVLDAVAAVRLGRADAPVAAALERRGEALASVRDVLFDREAVRVACGHADALPLARERRPVDDLDRRLRAVRDREHLEAARRRVR